MRKGRKHSSPHRRYSLGHLLLATNSTGTCEQEWPRERRPPVALCPFFLSLCPSLSLALFVWRCGQRKRTKERKGQRGLAINLFLRFSFLASLGPQVKERGRKAKKEKRKAGRDMASGESKVMIG